LVGGWGAAGFLRVGVWGFGRSVLFSGVFLVGGGGGVNGRLI